MPRLLRPDEQRNSKRRPARLAAVCLVQGLLWTFAGASPAQSPGLARPSPQPVQITDIQAGFAVGSQWYVRPDYWAPVTVKIRNRSGQFIGGILELIGRDRDGETIVYKRSVGLQPGEQKTITNLYWFARRTAGFSQGVNLTARLVDEENRLLARRTMRLQIFREGEHLAVDISPQPIAGTVQAAFPNMGQMSFEVDLRVAYLSAARLPTWWYCLQAADIVICDQPDALPFTRQDRRAQMLAQWVRQGGLLVLGPGSCETLRHTALWEALPAEPVQMFQVPPGALVSLERVGSSARLPSNIAFWELRPQAGSSTVMRLLAGGQSRPAVVRRRFELGAVVQSAIDLKTLLRLTRAGRTGNSPNFAAELLGLRSTVEDSSTSGQGFSGWYGSWPFGLTPGELLLGEASFRATGAVLASLLMLFAVLYGLAATTGTWVVLQRKGMKHYAWVAFAGCAVAGSIAAAPIVQSTRGVRADVKQRCVVDIDAASGMAHVRGFFGLKMPYDTRVSVELDLEPGTIHSEDLANHMYLRPAADLSPQNPGRFAVQRSYETWLGEQRLRDVPIRGTVKQFEGYWYGPANGTVRGVFRFDKSGWRLSPDSWIANYTTFDLKNCYLLLTRTELFSEPTRDMQILVLPIGDLASGQRRSDLQALLRGGGSARGSAGGRFSLTETAKNWLNNVVSRPRWAARSRSQTSGTWSASAEAMSAAMLTVFSDVVAAQVRRPSRWTSLPPRLELPRSGSRWLDLRNALDDRTAILVGLAAEPGPLRLKVNGLRIEPSSATCIVRVVMPLE